MDTLNYLGDLTINFIEMANHSIKYLINKIVDFNSLIIFILFIILKNDYSFQNLVTTFLKSLLITQVTPLIWSFTTNVLTKSANIVYLPISMASEKINFKIDSELYEYIYLALMASSSALLIFDGENVVTKLKDLVYTNSLDIFTKIKSFILETLTDYKFSTFKNNWAELFKYIFKNLVKFTKKTFEYPPDLLDKVESRLFYESSMVVRIAIWQANKALNGTQSWYDEFIDWSSTFFVQDNTDYQTLKKQLEEYKNDSFNFKVFKEFFSKSLPIQEYQQFYLQKVQEALDFISLKHKNENDLNLLQHFYKTFIYEPVENWVSFLISTCLALKEWTVYLFSMVWNNLIKHKNYLPNMFGIFILFLTLIYVVRKFINKNKKNNLTSNDSIILEEEKIEKIKKRKKSIKSKKQKRLKK